MPTDAERRTALSALADLSGLEFSVFDSVFPTRPWADVVPTDLWYRRDVLEHWKPMERNDLHEALKKLVGGDHAATLMSYLPPVPWHVLAPYGVYPSTTAAT